MELWAFLGLAFVLAVVLIWRSRRRTSGGPESMIAGLPDDLRDKRGGIVTGQGGYGGHGGGGGAGGGGGGGGGAGGGF